MRGILLVIDALGVGAMPDVPQARPQDRGTDTLGRIRQRSPSLELPQLTRLGLGHIAPPGIGPPTATPLASYGRCRLAYSGADSYLGHQEIMGTIPRPSVHALIAEVADGLEHLLAAQGHRVRRPLAGEPLLLVDEAVIIGDNLEADPGLNINLTVAVDSIDFARALEIGRLVRGAVQVARVIVFGGPGITVADILRQFHHRGNGQAGIDSPALGVYDEHLLVQHLGFGVDPERQAASLLHRAGYPVTLLGKMADLIACPGATRASLVRTPEVMAAVADAFAQMAQGLVAATVQETDLAGHEGDARRQAAVLAQVDAGLGPLIAATAPGDTLIICADHGNDAEVNVGQHTREETPLLVYQAGQPAGPLGVRRTLADIGATICHLFAAPSTRDGTTMICRRER